MPDMEAAQDGPGSTNALLSGADAAVFETANTITKWLLNQSEELRPRVAQEIFQKLMREASQSRQCHGNGHACVKLCSFVQQCAKSSDEDIRQWAFTEPLSIELFQFYLEWYEHDPHRALRLVLDVLATSVTSNPCPETGRAVKESILRTIISIAARQSSRQLTKSGLQCLDYFLNKRVVDLTDVSLTYKEVQLSVVDLPSLSLWKSFVFDLISWMELPYVCPLAGKCLVHIFRGLNKSHFAGFTLDIWREWFQEALSQNPGILEDIKNYVLAPIFKTDRDASLKLLEIFNRSQPLGTIGGELTDQGLLLQLATLELGKKYGLVEEPGCDGGIPQQLATIMTLHEATLDGFLAHPSITVRSSAFALLISSQATTKPFSEVSFSLLKKHLAAFHSDYDAKVRNEVLGHTKNLIKRAKNVITVAKRSISASTSRQERQVPGVGIQVPSKKKTGPETGFKDLSEARDVLGRHEAFLRWYMEFLKDELIPTASYQRHITAVKAALLTLTVGKHAAATDDIVDGDIAQLISSNPTWVRLLLDLLLDPFDDVRDAASTLLALLASVVGEAEAVSKPAPAALLTDLEEFCVRAGRLADRTGRADHGDGAARSQGLLCSWLGSQDPQFALLSGILRRLEDKISKAERDLGHAAIESPVHADFAAISHVWQVLAKKTYPDNQLPVLQQLQRQISGCSRRIWQTVKHVLCDDSPEGHLPEELEDIEGLETKDLLSYSFRAVHESSNLLRLIIGTLRLKKATGVPFPPFDVFRDTGYLSFDQLSSLRHRGAFSTVSYTFTSCCQITQSLRGVFPDIAESENLLRAWYQGALTCIMTQASTTRRSAGIPSLIAAVLSANAESPSFDEVYGTLEQIGKKPVRMSETDGSNLPQVHALNSLREIFRSSILSKRAEGYLARTLHMAATSLKSEVWAIRNCGLLLLRSLVDCLLGTGESKALIESGWDGHSVRISYNKYPTLPGVLLDLLRSADGTLDQTTHSAAAEAVFPVLDIIRRAGPPEEYREELRKHIEGYLGSRIWHVRELAARTLCSFTLQEDWATVIGGLLSKSGKSTNRLHGILLTSRFVIERKIELGVDIRSDFASVKSLLKQLAERQETFGRCAELQAAYLELLNLLAHLGFHQEVGELGMSPTIADEDVTSSALLQAQVGLKLVNDAVARGDLHELRTCFLKTLSKDMNTASRMLEAIPKAWDQFGSSNGRSGLASLYLEACDVSATPEIRAQALLNLRSLMDGLLTHHGDVAGLPSADSLDRLWTQLQNGDINPALSGAIIEASGTIMAALVSQKSSNLVNVEQRLRSWGDLLTECLDVDNPFDTRYSAAIALKSFFTGYRKHSWDSKYLPALSALYDSLIDDDDEIRDVAASAASGIIGTYTVAPTAADGLVAWLQVHFGDTDEFRARAVYRMTGQAYDNKNSIHGLPVLSPADEQVRRAMDFDDSLFAAEEQNLFIDEVRETTRWRRAYEGLSRQAGGEEQSLQCLRQWAESGLRYLVGLVAQKEAEGEEDGPLGWTSDQHVFAACARILLCATAVARIGGDSVVAGLLEEFVALGERRRVHGSLLGMARLLSD